MLRWLCLLSCLLVTVAYGQVKPGHFPIDELRSHIEQRVKMGFNQGIVIGLIDFQGSEIVAAGTLARDSETPADGDTLYAIGPAGKALTAAALAILNEEGQLSWADPVSAHLGKSWLPINNTGKPLTLQHLGTHTGALPRMPGNFNETDPLRPYADYSANQLQQFLPTYQLPTEPGNVFVYSNVGYTMLGKVLETSTGQDFEAALQATLLQPLGMANTVLEPTAAQTPRLAQGYAGITPVPPQEMEPFLGAGAHLTTAQDGLKFLAAAMQLKDQPFEEAFESMTKPYAPTPGENTFASYGWMLTRLSDAQRILWHNGATAGYACFMGFDPVRRRGVIILSNTASTLEPLGFYALMPQDYPLPALPKLVDLPRKTLETLPGSYRIQPGLNVVLAVEGDTITAQFPGQPQLPIFPVSGGKLIFADNPVSLFLEKKAGAVEALYIQQGHSRFRAVKVE